MVKYTREDRKKAAGLYMQAMTKTDIQERLNLYEEASKLGSAVASCSLGAHHYDRNDFEKAFSYYKLSVDQGNLDGIDLVIDCRRKVSCQESSLDLFKYWALARVQNSHLTRRDPMPKSTGVVTSGLSVPELLTLKQNFTDIVDLLVEAITKRSVETTLPKVPAPGNMTITETISQLHEETVRSRSDIRGSLLELSTEQKLEYLTQNDFSSFSDVKEIATLIKNKLKKISDKLPTDLPSTSPAVMMKDGSTANARFSR